MVQFSTKMCKHEEAHARQLCQTHKVKFLATPMLIKDNCTHIGHNQLDSPSTFKIMYTIWVYIGTVSLGQNVVVYIGTVFQINKSKCCGLHRYSLFLTGHNVFEIKHFCHFWFVL